MLSYIYVTYIIYIYYYIILYYIILYYTILYYIIYLILYIMLYYIMLYFIIFYYIILYYSYIMYILYIYVLYYLLHYLYIYIYRLRGTDPPRFFLRYGVRRTSQEVMNSSSHWRPRHDVMEMLWKPTWIIWDTNGILMGYWWDNESIYISTINNLNHNIIINNNQ